MKKRFLAAVAEILLMMTLLLPTFALEDGAISSSLETGVPVESTVEALTDEKSELVTDDPAVTESIFESVDEITESVTEDVPAAPEGSEGVTTVGKDAGSVAESESESVSELQIDIGEVHEIIEKSGSFSEAVIAIADRFGITITEAEELVSDMKALGDKYLGETALWQIILNDMEVYPGKYIVIALCILVFFAIVGFMIRQLISYMTQMRAMKINLASLKRSVDGDDSEEGKNNSLRYLISAKNSRIEALERENAEIKSELVLLCERDEELTLMASEVKKNTESALNITQETALSIAQLLCIAMDNGKLPLMSKEAKQIWLANTQAKIKARALVKDAEGGESDAAITKTVQDV